MSKFAAIGSDGTRCVVWGLGDTREDAERDAWEMAEGGDPQLIGTVRIDSARLRCIASGDIDAEDLVCRRRVGIGTEGLEVIETEET